MTNQTTPTLADLRQRIAESLATCQGGTTWDAMAGAVLADVQPELDRLARTAEDHARRITNLTAERTQLRARLAEQEEETMRQHDRAEQAEDLLRVAHDTSNKSEAERARAVQRAERAEQEANATATAAAHLTTLVRERAERAEAAIARVRALHQPLASYPDPDTPGTVTICAGCENASSLHPCDTLAALQPPTPAHNAGPSVPECRADDLHWPLQKHGE